MEESKRAGGQHAEEEVSNRPGRRLTARPKIRPCSDEQSDQGACGKNAAPIAPAGAGRKRARSRLAVRGSAPSQSNAHGWPKSLAWT